MMPGDDRTARFRDDLTALVGDPVPHPLAVAVSGGADSMALLALAAAVAPVSAATVDHRLRPGSAGEAAMVARWCADAGVPHTTLIPPDDWRPRSIQADARALRYRLLHHWAAVGGARVLLTAHHADDQAETFLMRAGRASGVAGLGGIPPVRHMDGLAIVRPLLGWRRAELRTLADDAGLPFVDDPSNADPRYDRARIRGWLADAPIDPAGLARSAAACAEAAAALDTMAEMIAAERRRGDGWDMAGLPREIRRRLVRRAIAGVRADAPCEGSFDPASNVEALIDALEAGRTATLAGVLATAQGGLWHFRPAPPRRSR